MDRDCQAVAGVNAHPLEHAFRTCEWKPGVAIISITAAGVPDSLEPRAYSVELGVYLP